MPGIGTIVNVAAVVVGSLIGMITHNALPEKLQNTLMKALGVAIMFVGISSTLGEMLVVGDGGRLSVNGTMLMIISLVIGTVIGELIDIEAALERLGDRIKTLKPFRNAGRFTEGFVSSTLLICIGAMAIVGSIRDGINHDPTMLYSKSILDFVSTMVFASTMGVGVLFSAVPLGIYQGLITFIAALAGTHFMPDTMVSDLSLVGSVLIFAIGINMFFGKKVKVGNMLPSLIVPIVYGIAVALVK